MTSPGALMRHVRTSYAPSIHSAATTRLKTDLGMNPVYSRLCSGATSAPAAAENPRLRTKLIPPLSYGPTVGVFFCGVRRVGPDWRFCLHTEPLIHASVPTHAIHCGTFECHSEVYEVRNISLIQHNEAPPILTRGRLGVLSLCRGGGWLCWNVLTIATILPPFPFQSPSAHAGRNIRQCRLMH